MVMSGRLWHYFNQMKWKRWWELQLLRCCLVPGSWPFYPLPVELLVKPPILIPRPETEELVDRIIRDFKEDVGPKRLSLAMLGAGFWCFKAQPKDRIKIQSSYIPYVDQFGGFKPFRKGSISNVHPFSSIFQNLYYRHKMVITCYWHLRVHPS